MSTFPEAVHLSFLLANLWWEVVDSGNRIRRCIVVLRKQVERTGFQMQETC